MNQAIIIGSIGLWRKFLKDTLEEEGINTICFVDTVESGMSYSGVPIITPEELPRYAKGFNGLVLVTFPVNNSRRQVFLDKVLGYFEKPVHVLSFKEVYKKYKNTLLKARNVGDFWLRENYDKNRALSVIDLLSDEKSKHIVESWIKFRETLDIDYLVEPEEPQYLPDDLELQRFIPNEYSFLDVGAFVGDTYLFIKKKLAEYGKKLVLYTGIEADQKNFSELVKTVQNAKNEDEKDILLNIACFSQNTFLEFSETGTTLSSVSSFGQKNNESHKIKVFANALDTTFKGFRFDIVKVDVEGSDIECLSGMKEVLVNSRAIVMACLYHRPEDVYEIPEFFEDLFDDYSFFVRAHGTFYIDTVLYAIPKP